jgi:hypothetical protein
LFKASLRETLRLHLMRVNHLSAHLLGEQLPDEKREASGATLWWVRIDSALGTEGQ